MAAKTLTLPRVLSALQQILPDTHTVSEGEDHGVKRLLVMPGNTVISIDGGKLVCPDEALKSQIIEALMFEGEAAKGPQSEDKPVCATPSPEKGRSGQGQSLVSPGDRQKIADLKKGKPGSLTAKDVINYINPKATEAEAYLFAEFCRRKGADPMTKQVYLVIYEGQNGRQANFIAGKEYFTEKAENHPQFDGMEAGIVVRPKDGGPLEYRKGTLWLKQEESLIGGWAKVYRKDRKQAQEAEVPLEDYDTKKNLWVKMPATMIRKVAMVQALREAFPTNLGGLYDRAEMGQAGIEPEFEVEA